MDHGHLRMVMHEAEEYRGGINASAEQQTQFFRLGEFCVFLAYVVHCLYKVVELDVVHFVFDQPIFHLRVSIPLPYGSF